MKYIVTLKNRTYEVEVEHGEAMILDEYEALSPSASVPAAPVAVSAAPQIAVTQTAVKQTTSGNAVKAPLPGNVLVIKTNVGQNVKKGDVLLIIEAMKMENEILAPSDGVVKEISVTKGQVVATGDTLVVI